MQLLSKLVHGNDVKPPRSVSRSRYFSNQTRARSLKCTFFRFVDANVSYCRYQRTSGGGPLAITASWPHINKWTSGKPPEASTGRAMNHTVTHSLTHSANSKQGLLLLRSHLKVGFIGFKEFGSGGGGPLPQFPHTNSYFQYYL